MKRWLPLSLILLAGIAAIVAAQWQHIATRPSAQAILSATADAQHEMTRVPSRLDRMSDADEISIGNQLAANYTNIDRHSPQTSVATQATEAYLQIVGDRVALHARRKLPWKFHYISDPHFVNAFALPGGHVFIGQGLITLMHSEDALAAILGHEVEHIDLRHCSERIQTEAHLRDLGPLGDLVGLPVEVFMAGYSKEQELEADRDGTALAVAAGYSPLGVVQLFTEFEKLEGQQAAANHPATPIDEATQLSLQTLEGYFESHPPSAQREQQLRELIQSQHWPTPPMRPLRMPALKVLPH